MSCTGQNSAVCGCGQAAVELVARLDAREDEALLVARTTTDAQGRFEVAVTEGLAGLWIDAPAYATKFVRVLGNEKDGLRVDLVAGVVTEGVIVDESGDPIAGAIVTWPSPDLRYFDAITGADGRFKLGPFAKPLVGVLARRPGFLARWLPLGGRDPLVLMDPRSVSVQIRDANGPVAGLPVELSNYRCRASATTGPGGGVELGGLAPGAYTLRTGSDLLGATREVWVGEGERTELAPLVLRTFAGIEVEVAAPPHPLGYPTSVTVTCPPASTRSLLENSPGVWSVGQLPGGACMLEAVRDRASTRQWVSLVAGQWAKARLQLPPSPYFKVPVKVVDTQGRPVDARVEYAGENGSGSGGSLELPPGRYQVWATDGMRVAQRVSVTVPTSKSVVVTLRGAAKVHGRVVASGVPVPFATVRIACTGEDFGASNVTDAQGRYELTATGLGPCELIADEGDRTVHRRLVLAPDARLTAELSLPASVKTTGLLVSLDAGPPLEPVTLGPISGHVVDARGRPVTDFDLNGRRITDATGHFEAGAEEHEVRLFAPGLGSTTLHESTWDGGTVVLGLPRVVAVRVVDAAGVPIPTAGVTLAREGPEICQSQGWENPVDLEGRGWIEVRPGASVRASAPGWISADSAVGLDGGVIGLRLGRGTSLDGVVMKAGQPVPWAEVCLEGPNAQHAITRADGTFSISGLVPGPYALNATLPGWSAKTSVDLRDGGQSVTVKLAPER